VRLIQLTWTQPHNTHTQNNSQPRHSVTRWRHHYRRRLWRPDYSVAARCIATSDCSASEVCRCNVHVVILAYLVDPPVAAKSFPVPLTDGLVVVRPCDIAVMPCRRLASCLVLSDNMAEKERDNAGYGRETIELSRRFATWIVRLVFLSGTSCRTTSKLWCQMHYEKSKMAVTLVTLSRINVNILRLLVIASS